jgi:uncharacterized protein
MQFNVSSLLKEHTGATREFEIDDDIRVDGDARAEPRHLQGHVRMDRTPRGILVRACARGTEPDVCSRCVRPLTYTVEIMFEEEYLPTIDLLTGAHVDAPEGEEDAYRIDNRHVIDLSEPAQQYWSLALEMAPVCRDDCAGLCPICGEDVASEGHACTRDQVDARWAKLAELKLH